MNFTSLAYIGFGQSGGGGTTVVVTTNPIAVELLQFELQEDSINIETIIDQFDVSVDQNNEFTLFLEE